MVIASFILVVISLICNIILAFLLSNQKTDIELLEDEVNFLSSILVTRKSSTPYEQQNINKTPEPEVEPEETEPINEETPYSLLDDLLNGKRDLSDNE